MVKCAKRQPINHYTLIIIHYTLNRTSQRWQDPIVGATHGISARRATYRREATSHRVRNKRNPAQVPEAARRVG